MKHLSLILLLFISCSKEPVNDVTPILVNYTDAYQIAVLNGVNNARAVNGLPPLLSELNVTEGAKEHSIYMDSINKPNHDFFQVRADNSHAERFGEIVTYNFTTPESQIGAILGSQPHRMMLLGDYTHIGIFIVGKYLTIDLAKYGNRNNNKHIVIELMPILTKVK